MKPLAVAVFARNPVPGQVKTRLIGHLGARGAAQLQGQLMRCALARAQALVPNHTELWLTDAPNPGVSCDVPVRLQQGGDLGARMAHAFEQLLMRYESALLIGTDCPAQTTDDLCQAAQALNRHDVVVQPAEDGGYVLIGLSARVLRHMPGQWLKLFQKISWGTAAVWAQTRETLLATGLSYAVLPTRPDLDVAQDYMRAVQEGWITAVELYPTRSGLC